MVFSKRCTCLMLSSLWLAFSSPVDASEQQDVQKKAREAAEKAFRDLSSGESRKAIWGELATANAGYDASLQRTDEKAPPSIASRDEEWKTWFKSLQAEKAGKGQAMAMPNIVKTVTQERCSGLLRTIVKKRPAVSEIFVMDRMGANVCAAEATSDFDQGDEPKWQEPFLRSNNPFVDKSTKDFSSGKIQTQVSFLLSEGSQKLGVVTIGIETKAE